MTKQMWTGRMRVVQRGLEAAVMLIDRWVGCSIPELPPENKFPLTLLRHPSETTTSRFNDGEYLCEESPWLDHRHATLSSGSSLLVLLHVHMTPSLSCCAHACLPAPCIGSRITYPLDNRKGLRFSMGAR